MTVFRIFEYYWFQNIPALLLAALLFFLHLWLNGFRLANKSILFIDGIILFIIAACSPLDFLGRYYLFSAHMIEHVMLLLIVPPLLLLGIDKSRINNLLSVPVIKRVSIVLFHPVTAWIVGVGVMWLWHIPAIFNEMNRSHSMHIYNLVSLIMAGLIFMWPVFGPDESRKLQPLQSAVYLFLACVGCTLLGIFITFAPAGVFTTYIYDVDPQLFNYIHSDWGITSSEDQQIGGLIMWVPACVVYLTNILIIINRWLRAPDAKESLI